MPSSLLASYSSSHGLVVTALSFTNQEFHGSTTDRPQETKRRETPTTSQERTMSMLQMVLGRRLLVLPQRRSALLSLASSTLPRQRTTGLFGYNHHDDRCFSTALLSTRRALVTSTATTAVTTLSSSLSSSPYHTTPQGGQALWWTTGNVMSSSGSGDRRRPYHQPNQPNYPHSSIIIQQQQRRWFTPMTKEEENNELVRVKSLSSFQKDQELRHYNRQLAKLELLKGINTGEIYTWTGRYKALARDYGMPLFAYYWVVWTSTAIFCYAGLTIFSIDCLALIGQVDTFTGWDMSSKIDPEMGKIGTSILLNEFLEPIRLPAVILTVKPVMDNLFPPKY
jgi:hypothetical protein